MQYTWCIDSMVEQTVTRVGGQRYSTNKITLFSHPELYVFNLKFDTGGYVNKTVYNAYIQIGLIFLHTPWLSIENVLLLVVTRL